MHFLRGASPDYAVRRKHFERRVRRGIDTFSWFIHRFNQPAFQALFVSTRRPQRLNGRSSRYSPEMSSLNRRCASLFSF